MHAEGNSKFGIHICDYELNFRRMIIQDKASGQEFQLEFTNR